MKDTDMIEAMRKFGGGFIQALAECLYRAYMENYQKLAEAFPVYFETYKRMAENLSRED